MILPTDVPTRAQVERLLAAREPASVSLYLPTDPASRGDAERIELKNLAGEAVRQLQDSTAPRSDVAAIDAALNDLLDDDEFWRYQARSVAVFASPQALTTFRLPNRLLSSVEVSDRFHLKPLLRSVTFPQVAFLLPSPRTRSACSRCYPTSRRRSSTSRTFPRLPSRRDA